MWARKEFTELCCRIVIIISCNLFHSLWNILSHAFKFDHFVIILKWAFSYWCPMDPCNFFFFPENFASSLVMFMRIRLFGFGKLVVFHVFYCFSNSEKRCHSLSFWKWSLRKNYDSCWWINSGENMDVKFSFGEGSLFGFDSWEGVTQGELIF